MIETEYLVSFLEPYLKEMPRSAAGPMCPERIELLGGQKVLRPDRLYMGEDLPAGVRVLPGTLIFIAGTEKAVSVPEEALVFRFSCSLADLYNTVAEAMENAALRGDAGREQRSGDFRSCWQDIADRRITGDHQIREAISRAGFPPGVFVRPSVVTFAGDPDAGSFEKLEEELQELFPGVNITEWKKTIILLLSEETYSFRTELPTEALRNLMIRYNAFFTLGNEIKDLDALPLLFTLVQRASEMGPQFIPNNRQRIFTYEEYSGYCVIDFCAKYFTDLYPIDDIIYLIHPAVVHLTRYDIKYNTNLRDILVYYLRNDRHLKTGDDTYYRSSEISKMKRILELSDLDLEDSRLRQRILFSCSVIFYCERVLKLKLKV